MKGTGWIRAAKSGYIATSMLWCAAGLLLIFLPGTSVKILCMAAGGLLTVCGIIKIIGYFSKDLYRLAFQFDLALGLLCLLLGLILLQSGGLYHLRAFPDRHRGAHRQHV